MTIRVTSFSPQTKQYRVDHEGKKGCFVTRFHAPQTASLKRLLACLKVKRLPGLRISTGQFHCSLELQRKPSRPTLTVAPGE